MEDFLRDSKEFDNCLGGTTRGHVVASLGFLVPFSAGWAGHLVGATVGALDELGAVRGWEEAKVGWAFEGLLFLDWFLLFNDLVFLLLQATGVGGLAVLVEEIVLG